MRLRLFGFIVFLFSSLYTFGVNSHKQTNFIEWRNARFGVFIHWGPNSILELAHGGWRRASYMGGRKGINKYSDTIPLALTDGSFMKYRNGFNVPIEIYDNLPHLFNPKGFNADEYVQMAKKAGAGYIVFTAKHMDGFAMFDSKFTDYDIMNTPYGKDICKQLSDACHKHGIKLIWYYCIWDIGQPSYDIENPKPYNDFLINQITELLTNYGRIDGIWWDAGGRLKVDHQRVENLVKKLQPHIIMNNRMNGLRGDYITPEQRIGEFNLNTAWESCQNMQVEGWFWRGRDELKTVNNCLHMLLNCVGGDGNLLLDFGPRADGKIDPPIKKQYIEMGKWLRKYGVSVYGTRGGPYKPGAWGVSTRKGSKVFIHITTKWPEGEFVLPALGRQIISCKALTGGEVFCDQNESSLILRLDPKFHMEPSTIIELEIVGDAMTINPIPTGGNHSLIVNKMTEASSCEPDHPSAAVLEYDLPQEKLFEEGEEVNLSLAHSNSNWGEVPSSLRTVAQSEWIKRHRGHRYRYWSPVANDAKPYLIIDFGQVQRFNITSVWEKESRVRSFELQYNNNGNWITYYRGNSLDRFTLMHDDISTDKIRIVVNKTIIGQPRINAVDVFFY